MSDLQPVIDGALADFAAARTPAELEDAKARYLGKAGIVTERLKALAALSPEQKKLRGAEINAAKQAIDAALVARRAGLAEAQLAVAFAQDQLRVADPREQVVDDGLHGALLGCGKHGAPLSFNRNACP